MSRVLNVGPANDGPPVGNYKTVFQGTEDVPANVEKKYEEGIRFLWRVTEGPFAGKVAKRVTSARVSEANQTGKLLSCLLGRAIKEGEAIDLQQFVGKSYLVVVGPSQGGGTRVESAISI